MLRSSEITNVSFVSLDLARPVGYSALNVGLYSATGSVSPETVEPPSYDYLLFSKLRPNAQNLMETFNSGLKELRASGRYDVILKAYEKAEYIKP